MESLPKIEAMLERQGRFWELRRRLAAETGIEALQSMAHLSEGPWLSVSKQLGAGGIEFARRLAHALGWQVFDHEILTTIAQNTHTRESVLSRLDEAAIGPINDYISGLLDHEHPGRTPFLQEMVRVIWGLAKQGNAIIVGRGANWFLDPRFGLRVRCVAPLETRIERVAREEGLSPDVARSRILANDANQVAFIQQVYRRRIDDPDGYDLILNLGNLELDAGVEAALTALRRRLGVPGGDR